MELSRTLIPLVVLVPVFTALALLFPLSAFRDRKVVWWWALGSTGLTFLLSVWIALGFDWEAPRFQMSYAVPWVESLGISFAYGLDAISLWLVLLSTFLMPLVILASWGQGASDPRQFYFWLLLVQGAMVGAFVATDLIFFFLCFEFTLIPLYFLIGVFGGHDRWAAARVFFIYTFAGSMLTFAGLLYVAYVAAGVNGYWSFALNDLYEAGAAMTFDQQAWVLAALLAGFAVKTPIFPLHTWLPITYREAPMAGTVVLSAVLAKLGTYGLIRFAIPLCPLAVAEAAPIIAVLAIIGILYAALICWVQPDLKRLVAYSSISHLGFCVLGLFALDSENIGPVGGVLYMVNHGLATGALFLCVGMLFTRTGTYRLGDMSGVVQKMPVWAFFTVFFVMASVGLPGLNGFVSEFLTLMGAFISVDVLGPWYGAAAAVGLILGAIYMLYMVGQVVFGPVKLPRDARMSDLTFREVAALAPIAAACVWLGLYPYPVLRSLQAPVADMTARAHAATLVADDAPSPDASIGGVRVTLQAE